MMELPVSPCPSSAFLKSRPFSFRRIRSIEWITQLLHTGGDSDYSESESESEKAILQPAIEAARVSRKRDK
jgi:hypothetical protein